jgi:antitoxin (DNA-binding transcriptional repressor) of toxin-antitoxin stability system
VTQLGNFEVKKQFSASVGRARLGEEIVNTRRDVTVARLVPVTSQQNHVASPEAIAASRALATRMRGSRQGQLLDLSTREFIEQARR